MYFRTMISQWNFKGFFFLGSQQQISCLHRAMSSIFFSDTIFLHFLFHYIHELLLWSPVWEFKTQFPSTNMFTISSQEMSKPSQDGHSDFNCSSVEINTNDLSYSLRRNVSSRCELSSLPSACLTFLIFNFNQQDLLFT